MTTKSKNLILIILAAVIFVLLFIPGFYVQNLWVCDLNVTSTGYVFYGYTSSESNDEIVSFVNTYETFNDVEKTYLILTSLILASLIACIVLYAIQYVVKGKENWGLAAFAPILPLVLLCVYTPFMNACCKQTRNEMAYPEYEIFALFYVVLSLLVALVAVSVIGYFITRKHGIKEAVAVAPISSVSSAQELERYKSLLDQGIITQEEFEMKKRQLLGL